MAQAALITIGDELLDGRVLDRNGSYLARRLSEHGIEVIGIRSVPDEAGPIREAIEHWEGRVDLLILTGGLGPTDDDRTKDVLMEHFGVGKERNETIENDLKEYLAQRGRTVSERDLAQADMPQGARIIRNPRGSAPAIRFDRNGTRTVALPGVPHEMRALVEEQLLPSLVEELGLPPIPYRSFLTSGLGESSLVREIGDIVERFEDRGLSFSYLASPGTVRIRLMDPQGKGEELLDEALKALKERIPSYFVGEGDGRFEELIAGMIEGTGKTLATAESCTGGYIAHLMSSVPGASAYFPGSVIAYSNSVKTRSLDVPEELLEKEGAVSRAVVERMALGVRNAIGSDIGLATSGIMGPSGGSTEKPVGTIWMAVSIGEELFSERHYLGQQREVNIEKGAKFALNLLRKKIQGF